MHTAREAFTVSLHVTAVVAAVVFAGLAVLVTVMRSKEPVAVETFAENQSSNEEAFAVSA